MEGKRRKSVGAFIFTPQGRLLLQHRDDVPGIMHPGMISTFGGTVEPGESIEEALERELMEEIELDVTRHEWSFHKTYAFAEEGMDFIIDASLFSVRTVNKQDLRLHEGKAIVELDPLADNSHLPLSPFLKLAIKNYFHYE